MRARHGRHLAGLAVLGLWSVRVVRVRRSVRRCADYWSCPRGQQGGLLYVALGDSVAQGVGATSPDRGYVGLLAQRMREVSGRPVRVVNISRSGAKLADLVRDQLPLLHGLAPDVVTVDIGGNDVVSYDAKGFAALLCDFTDGLPPGTYVAEVPYFMHGRWEQRASETGRLTSACAEASGLTVVPLHDAERARGPLAMLTDYAADLFHPNDRGHRVWADAFWERLAHDPVLRPAPGVRRYTVVPDLPTVGVPASPAVFRHSVRESRRWGGQETRAHPWTS